MYQVISVRVLRQVMDWMGIPAPWFRTTNSFRWPDGRLTSTIKCMWSHSDIFDWDENRYGEGCGIDGDQGKQRLVTKLWAALNEAFCEDVQIVLVSWSPSTHCFVAWLTCTVLPHDRLGAVCDEFMDKVREDGAL